ncbi:polyketide synthase, partial [Myxococcota bacterium]|nr:polyketide synthase [Myxococcota bacterium]
LVAAAPAAAAPPPQALPAPTPVVLPARPEGPAPIAIISLAGRFPGAPDIEDYWRLLVEGRDAVREVPKSRWDPAEWYDPDPKAPGKTYSRRGGFLDDIAGFDADFFRMSPREAEVVDPQQRLLLEVAWEALERAGYAGADGARTAVFVGATYTNYLEELRAAGAPLSGHLALGNSRALMANRLSWTLNLGGPSATVDTLCSSSLFAVQAAVESLRRGECDLALAGGAYVVLSAWYYVVLSRMGVLSPDGRCKTFDAGADGYVPGEGVGLVALKRLDDALRDGDPLVAVIRGVATNHDGRSTSLSAPNPAAQARLVRAALTDAGMRPEELGYVEVHGTGTSLGDPVEWEGLSQVFRDGPTRRQQVALSAVKSNLGHLEPAAGVAGLIKAALAVQRGVIPPSLHLQRPNPFIPFVPSAFYVPDRATPWPGRRAAGVSSFGMGGANAHVVLEEPPARPAREADPGPWLLTVSAHTRTALLASARRLYDAVEAEGLDPAEVCYTLAVGRAAMPWRAAAVVYDRASLLAALRGVEPRLSPARAPAITLRYSPGAPASERAAAEALLALGVTPERVVGAPPELHPELERGEGGVELRLAELAGPGASLVALGALWTAGAAVDRAAPHRTRPQRRIVLPTTPFERTPRWFNPPTPPIQPAEAPPPTTGLLWRRSWESAPPRATSAPASAWRLGGDHAATALLAAGLQVDERAEALLWVVDPSALTALEARLAAFAAALAAARGPVRALCPGEGPVT